MLHGLSLLLCTMHRSLDIPVLTRVIVAPLQGSFLGDPLRTSSDPRMRLEGLLGKLNFRFSGEQARSPRPI